MTRSEVTDFKYTLRDWLEMALYALSYAVVMFAAALGAYE